MNAVPLAGRVKERTKALHQETEELLLPKLATIGTPDDYARILEMFYGFFLPVQQRIETQLSATEIPDLADRRKAASLLHDLAAIGKPGEQLPLCTILPAIKNKAQAFGALYVLEGATLGGRIMTRMLRANNAFPVPEEALHFFAGYGDQTGSRWASFLQALNRQQEVDLLTEAANETFLCLKGWIQHCLYHD